MARILILAGGCRGRRLARELAEEGLALRITTRTQANRAAIEAAGAACWIGTPERLATLRGALENVTLVCWLLGGAVGSGADVRALHTARLRFFLGQVIDTTVRGFIYEARGSRVPAKVLAEGERLVRAAGERNALPVSILTADPAAEDAWRADALGAVRTLLGT